MRYIALLFSCVLSVSVLGCASLGERPSEVPCGELSLWVGQEVVVRGCLKFSCPSFPGVHFPEDCVISLEDESGVAYLGFTEGTESIEDMLRAYYEESFGRCVFLSVLGKVEKRPCETPGCTPWIFLRVEEVQLPGRGKNSSPGR